MAQIIAKEASKLANRPLRERDLDGIFCEIAEKASNGGRTCRYRMCAMLSQNDKSWIKDKVSDAGFTAKLKYSESRDGTDTYLCVSWP